MSKIKERLYSVLFEIDNRDGKKFNEALFGIILLSILVVLLESVASIRIKYGPLLRIAKWTQSKFTHMVDVNAVMLQIILYSTSEVEGTAVYDFDNVGLVPEIYD